MPGFERLLVEYAQVLRSPAVVAGKRGEPAIHIEEMLCTPLDPVDPEMAARFGLQGPVEMLQTYVNGTNDVREGDVLVVNGHEYPVKACGEWAVSVRTLRPGRKQTPEKTYKFLLLEELK